MPDSSAIAINTSPLIALVAAWGYLTLLESLYQDVWVSFEVCQEIMQGGVSRFAIAEFEQATWLKKQTTPLTIAPLLLNSLDLGEASVIQLALDKQVTTVCIDEAVGRRVARLSGLKLTGSVGILLKAKQRDPALSVRGAIENMLRRNICLSQTVGVNHRFGHSGRPVCLLSKV
jgi:predicted nucleic acid-binding protein